MLSTSEASCHQKLRFFKIHKYMETNWIHSEVIKQTNKQKQKNPMNFQIKSVMFTGSTIH